MSLLPESESESESVSASVSASVSRLVSVPVLASEMEMVSASSRSGVYGNDEVITAAKGGVIAQT